jgi:hypothetical protein
MIPYDDLVIALATWRARQGLPVAQLSGSLTPPPAVAPQAAPVAVPRSNPPAPPRGGATPPPLAPAPDTRDEMIDDGLIEEAQYDNEGNDFAMAFGGNAPEVDGESTSIGSAPGIGRDSFSGGGTEPDKGGNRNDW